MDSSHHPLLTAAYSLDVVDKAIDFLHQVADLQHMVSGCADRSSGLPAAPTPDKWSRNKDVIFNAIAVLVNARLVAKYDMLHAQAILTRPSGDLSTAEAEEKLERAAPSLERAPPLPLCAPSNDQPSANIESSDSRGAAGAQAAPSDSQMIDPETLAPPGPVYNHEGRLVTRANYAAIALARADAECSADPSLDKWQVRATMLFESKAWAVAKLREATDNATYCRWYARIKVIEDTLHWVRVQEIDDLRVATSAAEQAAPAPAADPA